MNAVDRAIIDGLQGGFPLTGRPFAAAGAALGLSEGTLLARLAALLAAGTLTRFGPLWDVEKLGGAYCLAALAVPDARFEQVAAFINALPEVAHNYARDHHLNMWFVLATESLMGIAAAVDEIESITGLTVYCFPKKREFFVEARFSSDPNQEQGIAGPGPRGSWREGSGESGAFPSIVGEDSFPSAFISSGEGFAPSPGPSAPGGAPPGPVLSVSSLDRAAAQELLRATQAGLPLVPEPYRLLADHLGLPESVLCERLAALLAVGAIRRIGAVPNHYALGWRANGMTVWDVADESLAQLGPEIGALPFVTHCYERPRRLPDWPYNLFAMVHGADRSDCTDKIAALAARLGSACRGQDVLWSTRILKKTGVRLRPGKESSCSE